ncbi:MAG: tRNA 2-thiocytidine(32) synthetase TtcA [Ruminococcaceae bacterium]|nr:tRNA 2-thiocytidine(32) synthetase TtcA [Oscillospiraceae bacterium]
MKTQAVLLYKGAFDLENIRRILSFVRRAVDDYNMIEEGDRIAVGVSGGKDSLTLLAALSDLRTFYPKKYELYAVMIDMGFEGANFSAVEKFCNDLGVELKIVRTNISHVIFDVRKEKNPCSLCARMRRGTLHDAVLELGCNKLALGHHYDDVLETFMLNLFHEGRLGTFSPVTYLDRKGLTMIRPMIYAPEKDVRYFATKSKLPVVKSPCPADGATKREDMKQFLKKLEIDNHRGLKHRIFKAICKAELDGYRET